MTQNEIEAAVTAFENDIIYDAHSLRARIGRSETGKKIALMSEEDKEALREYLKTHTAPTEYPLLLQDVEKAWREVLG